MVAGPRMGHGILWLYRDELLFKKKIEKKTYKKQASCSTSSSLGDHSQYGGDWKAKGDQNRIQIRLTVELGYPHAGWQNAELGLLKGNSQLFSTFNLSLDPWTDSTGGGSSG